MEAKEIAAGIKLDDRIEYVEIIITLKDHKDNFASGHSCRLINPWKREMGKTSKSTLKT